MNALGRELERTGLLDDAMDAYRRALGHDPAYVPAASNLARLLVARDQAAQAVGLLEPVAAAAPYDMPLAVNYANALLGIGRAAEAAQRLGSVVATGTAPAQAYNSLGIARYVQRDFAGAAQSFEQAIAAASDFAEAHENLAQALLQQGRYRDAWPEYEWRWRNPSNALTKRAFAEPAWDGAPLAGRTLLLHGEQGLGDTIQFVRFARMVPKSGGRIVLACQERLVRLLRTIEGIDDVIALGGPLPAFDCHMPLLSLPRVFGTTFDTIPDPGPYLSAIADSAISSQKGLRIGLNWAGRPLHAQDPHRNRSCPITHFAGLAGNANLHLYSLQFGPFAADCGDFPIIDLSSHHADFADTARLVAAMDLIITVDTALAHLAGAMMKPCWVLLPYSADWRWPPSENGRQPWYSSVRVFRQPTPGNWDQVFQHVKQEIYNIL
jgi:tetratricopeptide (TPR) repeat protein